MQVSTSIHTNRLYNTRPVSENPNVLTAADEPTQAEIDKADAAFNALFAKEDETPQSILSHMVEKGTDGLAKWQIDQMQKDIANRTLRNKSLSQEQIAALPPKQRVPTENKIVEEVNEKLKDAIAEIIREKKAKEEMDKHARAMDGLSGGNSNVNASAIAPMLNITI